MIYFYMLPNSFRSAVAMLASVAVIAQVWVINLVLYKYLDKVKRVKELVFETAVLANIFILTLRLAQVQFFSLYGRVAGQDFYKLRYLMTAIFILQVFILRERSSVNTSVLTACFASLPLVERQLGQIYVAVFILTIILFIVRSLYLIRLKLNKFKTELSFYSVKEAVDKLDTALMFMNKGGHVVLINRKMEELMYRLCKKYFRNGIDFIKALEGRASDEEVEVIEYDELRFYKLDDESVWRFNQEYIREIGCIQATGIEMSREWEYIDELKNKNEILERRKQDIRYKLENVKLICEREENIRARARIHDVLGQRISFLLQSLRSGKAIAASDFDTVDSLIEDAIVKEHKNISDELEILKTTVSDMGVGLDISGEAPKEKETAMIFMDIIAEGVSNAIRHGLADTIKIIFENTENHYGLKIVNNGFDSGSKREGQGISSMRKKIEALGGEFNIKHSPFCINISVPRRIL